MEKNIIKYAKKLVEKNEYLDSIADVETALKYTNLKDRYEFIYDKVCEILDKKFLENNYCDFKDDKCIANRENAVKHNTMGCCFSYINHKIYYEHTGLCKYMQDKHCTQKCITCKLFTCDYLKNKGIKFSCNDFLLIKCFFNKKQQDIISYNFFRKKSEIIEKLLKKDRLPYLISSILQRYII